MNISYTLTTCGSSLSWLRTRKCLVVNKEGREGGREANEGWGAGGQTTVMAVFLLRWDLWRVLQ